jgi:hypothetical protein
MSNFQLPVINEQLIIGNWIIGNWIIDKEFNTHEIN